LEDIGTKWNLFEVINLAKKIGVWIHDDRVWDKFKDYVLKEYGTLHAVLGIEVEKALKHYLGHYEKVLSHIHKPKEKKVIKPKKKEYRNTTGAYIYAPSGRLPKNMPTTEKADLIQQELEASGVWNSEYFQKYVVERMVRERISSNPTTVKAYVKELEDRWFRGCIDNGKTNNMRDGAFFSVIGGNCKW
jgi:hypothetical protein